MSSLDMVPILNRSRDSQSYFSPMTVTVGIQNDFAVIMWKSRTQIASPFLYSIIFGHPCKASKILAM